MNPSGDAANATWSDSYRRLRAGGGVIKVGSGALETAILTFAIGESGAHATALTDSEGLALLINASVTVTV